MSTGTSPYSGWVEERSPLNGANKWVAEVIEDIRASPPFPLTGGHYDIGMEFNNKPLLEWCLARHIKTSRSGPYHKNDNCLRTFGPSRTKELRRGAQDGGVFPV
jgi:hypothetical protein